MIATTGRVTLTAKEAAEYLGVSYWLMLEMVKRRQISCIKAGHNRVLFRRASLDAWMSAQEQQSVTPAHNGIRRIHG